MNDLATAGIAGGQRMPRLGKVRAASPFKIIAMAPVTAGVTCLGRSGATATGSLSCAGKKSRGRAICRLGGPE